MVDQIKIKNLGSNIKNTKVTYNSARAGADPKVSKVKQTTQNIDSNFGKVSQFISKEKVKEMAKEAPIDKTVTTRIKSAIQNGSYPVDLDKLADALFDAYKEMK